MEEEKGPIHFSSAKSPFSQESCSQPELASAQWEDSETEYTSILVVHYLQGFIYRLENRKIDTEYLLASSSSIYPRKLYYPWSFKTANLLNNNHSDCDRVVLVVAPPPTVAHHNTTIKPPPPHSASTTTLPPPSKSPLAHLQHHQNQLCRNLRCFVAKSVVSRFTRFWCQIFELGMVLVHVCVLKVA